MKPDEVDLINQLIMEHRRVAGAECFEPTTLHAQAAIALYDHVSKLQWLEAHTNMEVNSTINTEGLLREGAHWQGERGSGRPN